MKIVGFFKAIESEGRNIGLPMMFVNVAGCNSPCPVCLDANKPKTKEPVEITVEDVARVLTATSCPDVYLDCGEPFLQEDEMYQLLDILEKCAGVRSITVNTNGYKSIKRLIDRYEKVIVYLNYCSKSLVSNLFLLRGGKDQVKVMMWSLGDLSDVELVSGIVSEGVFIMAIPNPKKSPEFVMHSILCEGYRNVRVICPQHFYLGTK